MNNRIYLLIAIMILIYILGVLVFQDIFFDKVCYRFNPEGDKFRINCSDMIIENESIITNISF